MLDAKSVGVTVEDIKLLRNANECLHALGWIRSEWWKEVKSICQKPKTKLMQMHGEFTIRLWTNFVPGGKFPYVGN